MEKNLDFPNLGHAVLLLALLYGIQILVVMLFHDLGIQLSPGDPKISGMITVISYGIMLSLIMSYKNISFRQLFSPPGSLIKEDLYKIILPTCMVIGGGITLISDLDRFLLQYYTFSQEDIELLDTFMDGGAISMITVCFIAPFIEEMLFRGIILKGFLRNYSRFNSVLLSAALFAIYHFNLLQLVDAFILGIFFGWLYAATGSLWPSIFAHFLFNLVSIILVNLHGGFAESIASGEYHSPISLFFALIFVLLGLRLIHSLTAWRVALIDKE